MTVGQWRPNWLLTALNLRNGSGANFTTSYNQFKSWLLSANTNMAYMLSAQMAAMQLNVEAGLVSGGALICRQRS
jgi:hypothetical protein